MPDKKVRSNAPVATSGAPRVIKSKVTPSKNSVKIPVSGPKTTSAKSSRVHGDAAVWCTLDWCDAGNSAEPPALSSKKKESKSSEPVPRKTTKKSKSVNNKVKALQLYHSVASVVRKQKFIFLQKHVNLSTSNFKSEAKSPISPLSSRTMAASDGGASLAGSLTPAKYVPLYFSEAWIAATYRGCNGLSEPLSNEDKDGVTGLGKAKELAGIPRLIELSNDSSFFSGRSILHVFFPLNSLWESVSEVLHSRWRGNCLDQLDGHLVPWIIFQEVLRCRIYGVPVMCSSHPQTNEGNSDFYSVMHPMLRSTITGHVLGFLEYFVKCYVNGGAYSESDIMQYSNTKKKMKKESVIDLQAELVSVRRANKKMGNSVEPFSGECACLRDMIEEDLADDAVDVDEFARHYSSAFRVLGTLSKVQRGEDNILEPIGSFAVESDLSSAPEVVGVIAGELKKGFPGPKQHRVFVKTHKRMERELQLNMSRHPRFAPYFELLKIISFSAGLADTFCEAGVHPRSFTTKDAVDPITASLVPFPAVLPAPPIRRGPRCRIEISFDHVASAVTDPESKRILNCMIRDETKDVSLEERTSCLMKAARRAAREAVKGEIPHSDEGAIRHLDDRSLNVPVMATSFRQILQSTVCAALAQKVISQMERLCLTLSEAPLLLEEAPSAVSSYKDFCNLISYGHEVFIPRWMDARIEQLNQYYDDELSKINPSNKLPEECSEQLHIALATMEEQRDLDMQEIENTLASLLQEMNIAVENMESDPLGCYVRLPRKDSPLLCETRIKFGITDIPQPDDVVLGSHGGCGLKESRVLVERSSAVYQRHISYCASEVTMEGKRTNDKDRRYFHMDVPFEPFFGDFGALQSLYASHGSSEDKLMLSRCAAAASGTIEVNDLNVFDSFGCHGGHLAVCLPRTVSNLEKVSKILLNTPGVDGMLPIHVACMTGNYEGVKHLIDFGAGPDTVLPSGLYPLLLACQGNFHEIASLILQKGVCSDVNRCTPGGYTPLHWVVAHGNCVLAKELLENGALLQGRRRDNATALHLAASLGNLECVSLLMDKFPEKIFDCTNDRRLPLHFACLGNHEECASLLMEMLSPEDRQEMLQHVDAHQSTPFTLSLALGHINLVLRLCDMAGLHDLKFLAGSSSEWNQICKMVSETPILSSYFGERTENAVKKLGDATFEDVTLSEYTKEKVIIRCRSGESKRALIQECIRLRDPEFLQRVALYGSLTNGDVKQVLVAVAQFGLHNWPAALSNCGIDVCMDNIDGQGHNLLYLSAKIEEDDVLLKAVWKEFIRFTPQREHYRHIVNILSATPMRRQITRRTLGAMFREVNGSPKMGEADTLLSDAFTSVRKWSFSRSLGLQPSRNGIISAAGRCRPTVLQRLLSEGLGLQEDIQLLMLQEALRRKRMDNALTILLNSWPKFQINVKDSSNASLALQIQEQLTSANIVKYKMDIDEQEKTFTNKVMLHEASTTGAKEFFKKLSIRQFYPLKNGTFGVYSWLLANGTEKFDCPWDPSIDDEQEMNGFVCSCKRVCENPEEVEDVAASIGATVESVLNHPSFLSTLQTLSAAPLDVITRILGRCTSGPVVAACISNLALLKDRSAGIWKWLLYKVPAVKRELNNILDTVVSTNGATVLMRLLPVPEATELIDLALTCKNIVKALKVRDRYGRSAAHYLVSFCSPSGNERSAILKNTVDVMVTERLRAVISIYPPLLHQQDRFGTNLFILLASQNSTPALSFLTSLAPVRVLDRWCTKEGSHAIHVAAHSGSVMATTLLVSELGLNPNARTQVTDSSTVNVTPLHIAARNRHTDLFRVLLSLGADPLVSNGRNETPIHFAVQFGSDELYRCVRQLPGFWLLVSRGELVVSVSANLLLSSYYRHRLLQVMHPNRGVRNWRERTAFLEATAEGNITAIHELAFAGADLLSFDSDCRNALHFAAHRCNTSMLAQIIRYVILFYSSNEAQQLLVQTTCSGDTPIHIAATSGSEGCVVFLLSFQCVRSTCLWKQNNKGLTPASAAVLAGNSELAVLIREASSGPKVNHCSALHPKHEAKLHAFWSAVTPPAQERGRGKLAKIQMINMLGVKANTVFSKEVEEAWERAWGEEYETVRSLLQPGEATTFATHPALSSSAVRVCLHHVLCSGSSAAVSRLLHWAKCAPIPSHAICFCVENIVIWETVENWEAIFNVFSATAGLWNIGEGQYPVQHHVLWEWLHLFFSPKPIHCFYKKEFFATLEKWLTFLKGPIVDFLPRPEISLGSPERGYVESATEKLKIVTDVLSFLKDVEEMNCTIRHLNYLWAQSCSGIVSLLVQGSHWKILENKVFHRFGVRSLSSIRFLESSDEPLTDDARSFGLKLMSDAPEETSSSLLLSWTTAATLAVNICGLDVVESVCSQLLSNVSSLDSSPELPYLLLPFFTSLVQSMVELESKEVIMGCVCRPHMNEYVFADEYMEEVSGVLSERIAAARKDRLGHDRPIEELITAFGTTLGGDEPFEPHLFSFDGTPIVTLSPKELALLREITVEFESCSTEMLSSNFLKDVARAAGEQMKKNPSARVLGQLVAYVREGIYRTKQKRPFRVQCMCVASIALPLCMGKKIESTFRGRLAQVATGEGKSIIVAMMAATFALMGQTVDIITSSRPLAVRDAEEFAVFYQFWGYRSSHISVDRPTKIHFNAEVVYGTNTDFEFVQLREGCLLKSIRRYDSNGTNSWVNRPKMVSIVDEADNLFLDAAQNSARIAYATGVSFTWVYAPIFELVSKSGSSSPAASEVRQKLSEAHSGYYATMVNLLSDAQLEGWVEAASIAIHYRKRETDYIVKQQKVCIIDLDTGRLQESSRWARGVHEMVEVKEGVPVRAESGVIGSVAHPSFFDGYSTVLGITGTAGEPEEREEVVRLYGIESFDVPPHRPCLRRRLPTVVFDSKSTKQRAIVESALALRREISVLILMPTIQESNELVAIIKATAPDACCLVLNETQREDEEFVLLKASAVGTILVATNTAGRGTDIRPSSEVLSNGGLHVIYGAFPPNMRVECQGLGRSARQGQPGSIQIFISLDEKLVRSLVGRLSVPDSEGLEDFVKRLYEARTRQIQAESARRAHATSLERVYFACLQNFFSDQKFLFEHVLNMKNLAAVSILQEFATVSSHNIKVSVEELFQRLRECFRSLWVYFYTQVSDQRDSTLVADIAENMNLPFEKQGSILYTIFLERSKWPSITAFKEQQAECLREVLQNHQRTLSRIEIIEEDSSGSETPLATPSQSNQSSFLDCSV